LNRVIRSISSDSNLGKYDTAQIPSGALELPADAVKLDTSDGIHRRNGFRTKPEIDVIRVSERNIPGFVLPLEALTYEPPKAQTFVTFPNGDSERMIHCNIALNAEEIRQLAELRARAERASLAFSPSVSVAATRFICDTRGDVPKALEKMRKSQAWREKFFSDGPITIEMVEEDLAHGMIYFGGRDYAMRPVVVVRPSRAPKHYRSGQATDRIAKLLIFCLEYFLRYMAVPGKVENICILVDLKDSGYLPPSCLQELAQVMSQQNAARVWRFYICNMNFFLTVMSKLVQAAMTDRQVEKINFVSDLNALRKDFAPHQLETDFGGTLPVIKTFFPFPCQPGPFEPSCSTGPNENAVQGVHLVLTAEGVQGRLWDPALSPEENTRLEFTDEADAFLKLQSGFMKRCELPISPKLLEAVAAERKAREIDRSSKKLHQEIERKPLVSTLPVEKLQDDLAGIRNGNYSTPARDFVHPVGEREELEPMPGPEISTQEVCPAQVFSCHLFKCSVGISKRVPKE